MNTQLIIMLVTLAVLAGLGFALSRSIKKHDAKQKKVKKKKGRSKYMPEARKVGR